jgi:hypothetical protein
MSPVEHHRPEPTSALRPKPARQLDSTVPTPAAAPSTDTMASLRQDNPVRRWTVRIYTDTDDRACDRVQRALGRPGGDSRPSLSEICVAAFQLADTDPTFAALLTEQVQRNAAVERTRLAERARARALRDA